MHTCSEHVMKFEILTRWNFWWNEYLHFANVYRVKQFTSRQKPKWNSLKSIMNKNIFAYTKERKDKC